MSFEEHAANGNALGAFRLAVVYGALWSIGSAWSNAIREVTLVMLPDETHEIVLGELLAVGIVTVLGVGVSMIAFCKCTSVAEAKHNVAQRSQLAPARAPRA